MSVSYRYIRWTITATTTGYEAQANELRLFLSGSPLSWNGSASATGPYGYGAVPGNLCDNSIYTKWESQVYPDVYGPVPMVIDNTVAVTFDGYCYGTANDMANQRDPTAWTLEGSNDGSTWTLLDTQTGFTSIATREAYNPEITLGHAYVEVHNDAVGVTDAKGSVRGLVRLRNDAVGVTETHADVLTPYSPPPSLPTPGFLYYELWSALECEGGQRLGFFLPIFSSAARKRLLTGDDALECSIVRTHRLAPLAEKGKVIREVLSADGTNVREWRIDKVTRSTGAGASGASSGSTPMLTVIDCVGLMMGLVNYPVTTVDADGFVYTDTPAVQIPVASVFTGFILSNTPSFLALGTVTPTDVIEVPFSDDSALSGCRRIEGIETGYETSLRRNGGTQYLIDYTVLGASADTIYLRTAKNMRGLTRTIVDGQVTRVTQITGAQGDDGVTTTAWAYWEVVSASGTSVVLKSIHGGDGPIAFDNQLNHALLPGGANSLYLEKMDTTTTQITGSVASTQTLTVASTSGISAGDWVRIVASSTGKHLTQLDAPDAIASYGVLAGAYTSGWDDTVCVVKNPLQADWSGTLPDNWTGVGGKTTAAGNWLTAGQALLINQSLSLNAQIAAPPTRTWYIRNRRTTFSASAWIRLLALPGTPGIGFQVKVNGTVVGAPLIYQTPANVWVQLKLEGMDFTPYLGTSVTIGVELFAAAGGTVNMLVDSLCIGPSLTARAVTVGANASRTWEGVNDYLADQSALQVSYQGDIVDLYALGYPQQVEPVLGGNAVIVDDELGTIPVRIVEIDDVPNDPAQTSLIFSNIPARLSRVQADPLALTIPLFDPLSQMIASTTSNGSGALLCKVTLTASDATTVTCTVFYMDTLGGTPTLNYTTLNATYVSGSGAGPWVFQRPISGTGTGQVIFSVALAGRTDVFDVLSVPEQASTGLIYNQCNAVVTAVDATTVTITVTAVVDAGTPQVKLAAITGSASCTRASGTVAGTLTTNGSVWVINRPAFGSGIGQVQFTAVTTGAIDDSDYVDIPEVGRDTVYLVTRARVTATDNSSVTVRVAVADPYPQGANSAAITWVETGVGAVTPSGGGTVTPVATITEASGTYIDYTVSRPAFGAGSGRVIFTGTASNRVSDSDSVDIPCVSQDTVTPYLQVAPQTPAATTEAFKMVGQNPTGGSDPNMYVTINGTTGSYGPTSSGGTTLTPGVSTLIPNNDYVLVARPVFGSDPASIIVKADLSGITANGGATTQSVGVDNQDSLTTPNLTVVPGTQTSTTQPFTVTATDPNSVGTPVIVATLHGASGTYGPSYNPTAYAIAADTPTTITSGYVVVATRPAYASAPATASFVATLNSGVAITVQRTVLNQDGGGADLQVNVTPGATSYSIAWAGSSVSVAINGASYGTPATSPIVVSRNAAGGGDITYCFKGTVAGTNASDTVHIPEMNPPALLLGFTGTPNPGSSLMTASWQLGYSPSGGYAKLYFRDQDYTNSDLSGQQWWAFGGNNLAIGTLTANITLHDQIVNGVSWNRVCCYSYSTGAHPAAMFFRIEIYDGSSALQATAEWSVPYYWKTYA